jgi:hypothetical protein
MRKPVVPWWQGWAPLLFLPGFVALFAPLFAPSGEPRWLVMWVLAFVIFCGCKWLTWRRTPRPGVPAWRHLAYLVAWPGLDAPAFLRTQPPETAVRPTIAEGCFALAKMIVGVGMVFGLARLVPADLPYLVGWVGMVGIVMTLHFGLFHLLSCAWRSVGIEAKPLMNWPLAATSLSDFWGRRWNTAFRDLTHRFLFRPLMARLGPSGAVFAGFVFSGVVHDLVISWPAGGGWGGPTLFFLIQGVGLLVERGPIGRFLGLGDGWRGWVFTLLLLVLPLPLLFHGPFVVGVIVPFLHALGAI